MAGGCCWTGRGGIGGGVPRKPVEGKGGGGGGGRGGGGGGGVLELWPAVRAGDWGLLSEKPELELITEGGFISPSGCIGGGGGGGS